MCRFRMRNLFIFPNDLLKFRLMSHLPHSVTGLSNLGEGGSGCLRFCVRVVFLIDVGEGSGFDIEVLLESETDD